MTATNKKILNTLLAIDIGIIIFCILSGHRNWLYTTQIGFFTSALVIAASMMSYRQMVQKRLDQNAVPMDNEPDVLDKIDDPHDLYSEEITEEKQKRDDELSKEEFVAVVKEEKAKLKANKRSIGEVMKDSRASLSFYRIGAYILLVLGFFYLNRHEYLHIPSYLFALSVPPVIAVIMLMSENRKLQREHNHKESHEKD
ncbi:MAG: hypothetical protein U9Q90_02815 [Campylobacterota bacterium]|nr:hypothetical protein [Campylobacterota bacterium]